MLLLLCQNPVIRFVHSSAYCVSRKRSCSWELVSGAVSPRTKCYRYALGVPGFAFWVCLSSTVQMCTMNVKGLDIMYACFIAIAKSQMKFDAIWIPRRTLLWEGVVVRICNPYENYACFGTLYVLVYKDRSCLVLSNALYGSQIGVILAKLWASEDGIQSYTLVQRSSTLICCYMTTHAVLSCVSTRRDIFPMKYKVL